MSTVEEIAEHNRIARWESHSEHPAHRKLRAAVAKLTAATQKAQEAQAAASNAEIAISRLINEMESSSVPDNGLSIHYRVNLLGQHKAEWFR